MLEKLPESIGHALSTRRAGLGQVLFNKLHLRDGTARLEVTSPAFVDHGPLPSQYSADEKDPVSPPLRWSGVPESAASLALIVEDADSPTTDPLVHAIAVDIASSVMELQAGALHEGDPAV